MKKILAFLALCLTIDSSNADQLSGRVLSIADGDTLTILTENKQEVCGVYRLDRDNDGIPCESIC